jgi:hypothetical protein
MEYTSYYESQSINKWYYADSFSFDINRIFISNFSRIRPLWTHHLKVVLF